MNITIKARTALTVAAASLGLAAFAGPAMAADNAPTLPAAGCIVSIDGHDHTVPAGTVVMGLVCGTDGDWHLPKKSASPTTSPYAPITSVKPTAASAYSPA
ncbi:MAG: hypothetical protein QOG42_706 [Solirubrobacteraceae bacterium]|jgi:hypothetical protein|nr:hypothetical protein [Solirubrobacteraceae bacterium]